MSLFFPASSTLTTVRFPDTSKKHHRKTSTRRNNPVPGPYSLSNTYGIPRHGRPRTCRMLRRGHTYQAVVPGRSSVLVGALNELHDNDRSGGRCSEPDDPSKLWHLSLPVFGVGAHHFWGWCPGFAPAPRSSRPLVWQLVLHSSDCQLRRILSAAQRRFPPREIVSW